MKKSAFIFSDGELKRKDSTVLFESEDSKIIFRLRISAIFIFSVRLPLQRSFWSWQLRRKYFFIFITTMNIMLELIIPESIIIPVL